MKKSRSFLGLTAFTLAVASAIAAKVKNTAVTYYYTAGIIVRQCVTISLAARTDCIIGGTGCVYIDPLLNQWQLYTSKSIAGACQSSLEPK